MHKKVGLKCPKGAKERRMELNLRQTHKQKQKCFTVAERGWEIKSKVEKKHNRL